MRSILSLSAVFVVLLPISFATAQPGPTTTDHGVQDQTAPLMRGTLWWLSSRYTKYTEDQLRRAIQAQRDVGFDLLWLCNTPKLFNQAEQPSAPDTDWLDVVFTIADSLNMRIIADLPQGGWYGKATASDMLNTNQQHIHSFHARYGHHESFWGWYLNYEINPIVPGDVKESEFWRSVWRGITDECHRTAPGSVVTISPFFLLDADRRRGFVYLTPSQYAEWWGETMRQTGIDILMLQDSGEHLSFFTLEQREPFFAAVAKACHDAGTKFWVNVETGEALVKDWDEYLALEKNKKVPWRFTPIDWLEKKLDLAARYGDGIVNWGYFPFMDPMADQGRSDQFRAPPQKALAAYQQYRDYYLRVRRQPINE